jgi:hypothetical protein
MSVDTLNGSFRVMPLAELLQWLGNHTRTGVLEISRGRTRVQLAFEDGRIAGCAADDPPSLLGQFLLAHGKIDEQTLHDALLEQERNGGKLGDILELMGKLEPAELQRIVEAKSKETIFRLFDWPDAEFRFGGRVAPMATLVRLDLRCDEVLTLGTERQAQLESMRSVFNDPGKVLVRTSHALDSQAVESPMVRRLYDLVDGHRSFEQIHMLSRAPEFHAMKFLFELQRRGIVAVKDLHERAPEPGSAEAARDLAGRLSGRGELEAAIEILQAAMLDNPRNEPLERDLARYETTYLEQAYRETIPHDGVPQPAIARDRLGDLQLSGNERFVFDLISENRGDVRSVVRLAPLHEIDVIRALAGLLRRRAIEVKRGQPEARKSAEHRDAVLQSLNSEIDQSLGVFDASETEQGPART